MVDFTDHQQAQIGCLFSHKGNKKTKKKLLIYPKDKFITAD
jgi:hypothetical protein